MSVGRALFVAPLVGAVALIGISSECAAQVRPFRVNSIPTSVSVPDGAAQRLRGGQQIAIKNAYDAPTKLIVGTVRNPLMGHPSVLEADLHEFTDTAISVLERRMEKDGITMDAEAKKSITLRVRRMSATNPYGNARVSVTLEAALGNGTKTTYQRDHETAWVGWSPAFDGAVLKAVIALLHDVEFLAYVDRP